MIQEEVDIWDKQPGESQKQYDKFCKYRDMKYKNATAKRSIRKLAEETHSGRQTLETYSSKFSWVARAEAYDLELERQARAKNEADILKMKENHALLATQMLKKALKRLLTIPENELTAQDIVRLADAGVKIERLSRGEATEKIDGKHEVTGKDGGPIETESKVTFYIPSNGRDG